MLYALMIHFCTATQCEEHHLNSWPTLAECEAQAASYRMQSPESYLLSCEPEGATHESA